MRCRVPGVTFGAFPSSVAIKRRCDVFGRPRAVVLQQFLMFTEIAGSIGGPFKLNLIVSAGLTTHNYVGDSDGRARLYPVGLP